MAHSQKELGALAGQLARALDDLALAVETYRIREHSDPGVIKAMKVAESAILKARRQSLS